MKGKKLDSKFHSDFIEKCIKDGIFASTDIASSAQKEIDIIDRKIIEVEKLKVRRGKLLDVVMEFGPKTKRNDDEIKILEFAKIKNPQICKFICDLIKNKSCNISNFNSRKYSQYDINFCIKQLLEHRIISKIDNLFSRGEQYETYLKLFFKANV